MEELYGFIKEADSTVELKVGKEGEPEEEEVPPMEPEDPEEAAKKKAEVSCAAF